MKNNLLSAAEAARLYRLAKAQGDEETAAYFKAIYKEACNAARAEAAAIEAEDPWKEDGE